MLNPVQTGAVDMDPARLKEEFGDQLVFWGGGVDTQKTLPFGDVAAVRQEVAERIRIFGPGGGFICNPIHNVQSGVPIENLLTLYETAQQHRDYPLQ